MDDIDNSNATMSDLNALLGITETPTDEQTPAAVPETEVVKPTTETTPVTGITPAEQITPAIPATTPAVIPAAAPVVDKAGKAFAEMRVQNKTYQQTLQGVASILGVDVTKPEELITAIQAKVTEAQAKEQNVPPELLTRLNQLEQDSQKHAQEEIQRNAYLGFQNLKTTYNLTDDALQAFANNLAASGINPFEQQVDVVAQYKVQNFDKLMAEAEARGKQAEIARSTKASEHSATVTHKDGQSPAEAEKINTVADLTKWMNEQSI